MRLRKLLIALSIAGLLAGSVEQSKANMAPVAAAPASSSIGAGPYIVGSFIVFVAILCAYDFALKVQGVKNWDGTQKAMNRR